MGMDKIQAETIQRCQGSVVFFLRNFCKTKHPSAGIVPFHPFKYQVKALRAFRNHRFSIFRKCRQSGASTISGAFALWFSMFFSHKTVLIVSRTDDDAKSFLRENVAFLYKNLPPWMQEVWKPIKENEHEIVFPNGSHVRSLTSHPDVLRSNASSLNIIDEAAFIQDMSQMWAGGFSTLQHGGSVIVVSTTNGVGNWYWNTWVDAEANLNPFEPIMINWWDMDWRIEYKDPLTDQVRTIAPTDGIRECNTAEEIQKYGPYWSPWLEEQWRGLQERGESWKFEQEVRAEFVGSGNTVLDPLVLAKIQLNLSDDYKRVIGNQPYIHPVKGEATFVNFDGGDRALEADEGLWVWHKPNEGTPAEYHNGIVINPAIPPHRYVGGVDLATGKGRDYNSIELFDIDTMEQVAEIMIRCIPRLFKYIVDYIGRWYNNALLVVERNNGGDAFIDDLRMELMYPNLWRKKSINDKPSATAKKNRMKISEYGFSTGTTSKNQLNSALQNFFRADDEGIKVNSRRLLKQFQIYVRKKDRTGRDTQKTEAEDGPGNFDDLVIAAGLAVVGLPDAVIISSEGLMPFQPTQALSYSAPIPQTQIEALGDVAKVTRGNDPMFLMPFSGSQELTKDESIQAELARFAQQLGALPLASQMPTVTSRKHQFNPRK